MGWVSSRPFSAKCEGIYNVQTLWSPCTLMLNQACASSLLSNKRASFLISFPVFFEVSKFCRGSEIWIGRRALPPVVCGSPAVCLSGWTASALVSSCSLLDHSICSLPLSLPCCICCPLITIQRVISRALARRSYGFLFRTSLESLEPMQHPRAPFGCP